MRFSDECVDCRPLWSGFPFDPFRDANSDGTTLRRSDLRQPTSALLTDAFASHDDLKTGLSVATDDLTLSPSNPVEPQLINTATSRYYRHPNCFAIGIYNGLRGMAVGSVFGGAMGLSTAVQSGYRGASAASVAGQGALRNAAAFGSWTAMYGFTRCALIRLRRRDDIVNSAVAGALTGATLTVISLRGRWRYQQTEILTNAGASAMIAVMFHALNQM